MSTLALVATRAVVAWAATYTLGLAATVRDARLAEITSDAWEQRRDETEAKRSGISVAASMLSRSLRGVPADLMWRINVEGPKMDIRIPFERIVGGLMLAMVVLFMITTSISGYDTGAKGFEGEITRLSENKDFENAFNAFFRGLTGFALLAAGALFYVTLRERSRPLATIAAFGICAAAVLELVAGALQITFVRLADEYVATTGTHQESVLVTARAVAIAVEQVTAAAFMALVLSIYVLAVLTGREGLVPRWLIGIPIMSAALIGGALIADVSGAADGVLWIVLMSGMFLGVIWLGIAGLWLLLTKGERAMTAAPAAT